MLGSIGFTELLFIFLIVVVLFGARKIPEIGRGLGSGIQNFKAAMRGGATADDSADSDKEKDVPSGDDFHADSSPVQRSGHPAWRRSAC